MKDIKPNWFTAYHHYDKLNNEKSLICKDCKGYIFKGGEPLLSFGTYLTEDYDSEAICDDCMENNEEKCDRCGKVDDDSETYYIANNPEELLCKPCAVQP